MSDPPRPTYITPAVKYRIPEVVDHEHRLGRNVNHDPRSLRYQVGQPAQQLHSVLHEHVGHVMFQGDLGACTGYAAVACLGSQPLYDELPEDHPDLNGAFARQLYSESTEIDATFGVWPPEDTGSDGLSCAKAVYARGLISGYLHATSLNAMRNALQATPVSVGTNWYAGMDLPDERGLVHAVGELRGAHQYAVIGMDEQLREFTCVQSWGPEWGVEGYFRISYDDMEKLLANDGDCTQMLPLNVPSPKASAVAMVEPGPVASWLTDLSRWLTKQRRKIKARQAKRSDHHGEPPNSNP